MLSLHIVNVVGELTYLFVMHRGDNTATELQWKTCATVPGSQTLGLAAALFSGTSEVSFMVVSVSFVEREKEKVWQHRE